MTRSSTRHSNGHSNRHLPSRALFALTLALLLALIAGPFAVHAQAPAGPGDGPGFGPRGHRGGGVLGDLGFLARFLDLTEEQKEQARALRETLRADSELLQEESRVLRETLQAELDAESPDPTRVGELAIALHGQRQELQQLRQKALTDFEALLTQDQLESFRQLRESIRERRQDRRERRGRRGGP